jgi:16S rRNA (guanine527-N7)-methyltransferase
VEDLPRSAQFDVVTARAVAPLARLAAWCAPVLAPEGSILALKGERADAEVADAAEVLRRTRLDAVRVVQVGTGLAEEPTRVVVLTRTGPVGGGRSR